MPCRHGSRNPRSAERQRRKLPWWLMLLLLALILVIERPWQRAPAPPQPVPPPAPPLPAGEFMSVVFFDVGQGDAALVQLPDGKNLLIDGGTSEAGEELVAELQSRGIEQLDLVVATHPHEDHIGGLPEVIAALSVQSFGDSGYDHGTPTQEKLLRVLSERNVRARLLYAGQTIRHPSANIWVLAPPEVGIADTESDANNNSVVLRIAFGSRAFLFAGDMQQEERDWLLAQGVDLRSDVLKVAHHGSHNGTDTALLEAVKPEIAVISCGANNRYGHPHQETLALLKRYQVRVLRTDQEGTITVRTDGEKLDVSLADGRGLP